MRLSEFVFVLVNKLLKNYELPDRFWENMYAINFVITHIMCFQFVLACFVYRINLQNKLNRD